MVSDERNALAELAKNLEFIKIHYAGKLGCVWTDKAQRIISELAKVRWWRSPSEWKPCGDGLSETIIKCRAIAEE